MTIQVPPHLVPIIQQASEQTGIPFAVLAAKLSQESNFNPNARGAAGEIGISQIMPATAQRPGYGLPPIELAALSDPAQAIPWGARYLAARARAQGVTDWTRPEQAMRGLAAYNGAGPQAARYGRRVAEMAGMVVPPERPTADSGDAPVAAGKPPASPLGAEVLPEAPDPNAQMVRRVQDALRMANFFTGGY